MIAEWHDWSDGGAYLQVTGGIQAEVYGTGEGDTFTFKVCGIPMPPSFVYSDREIAKSEAVKYLRQHLHHALKKL